MKKHNFIMLTFIMLLVVILIYKPEIFSGDSNIKKSPDNKSDEESALESQLQSYPKDRLYVPTQIIKIKENYFIVDCFQHRVIYSNDLNRDIGDWNIIDYEFSGPHSIAFDGNVYVIDNAGRNEILIFNTDFELIQRIQNVGDRPHKTLYTNDRFYVLSSQSQTIYSYIKVDGKLIEEYHKTLDFLDNSYVRSIKVIEDKMYFVANNNRIFVTNHLNGNYEVLENYTLPDVFTGLNDIEKYNGEFYLTSMGNEDFKLSPSIIKSSSLEAMSQGIYEDLYTPFSLKDKPYFMEIIGDKMFFTEVGEKQNSILSIDANNVLTVHFRFSELLPESIERRETYPR